MQISNLSTVDNYNTVKPPIKDTPKRDNLPTMEFKTPLILYRSPYKITSKRGQLLYRGQKAGSQAF